MKKILALFLVLIAGIIFADNTIIAIVNNSSIALHSIQNKFSKIDSNEEKIEILNAQIDIVLQLQKVNELNLIPIQEDIESVIIDVAKSNNLSIGELNNLDDIDEIKKEISDKLSILNLQRFITQDIEYPNEQILSKCSNNNFIKDQKQIKIAQIIISEISSDIKDTNQKNILIKSFLNKLSKHISKGASFEAFAKLHSQHPSYKDGGLTEWLTVNNPTLEIIRGNEYIFDVSDNTVSDPNLHLKSISNCIDAGVDLGASPTNVAVDIDGRNRHTEEDTWDLGADEYTSASITGKRDGFLKPNYSSRIAFILVDPSSEII